MILVGSHVTKYFIKKGATKQESGHVFHKSCGTRNQTQVGTLPDQWTYHCT
jgi:hypothetical protein